MSTFRQFDSFQSPCPTTSRHSVIPDRNIRPHQADSSLQILLDQSLRRGRAAVSEMRSRTETGVTTSPPAQGVSGRPKKRLSCDGDLLSLAKQKRFKRRGFFIQGVRRNGAIYLVARPSWAVIPPGNITRTRSCWTARLNQVTFAPQASDLRCCGRCKATLVFSQSRLTIPARCSVELTAYCRCSPRRTYRDARGSARTGPPFDTGITAIQSLFTGTMPKVASLVAIVIGGYAFAQGETSRGFTMSISAANPTGLSYLFACLVEPANKRLPAGQRGDGLCSTCGGHASSNRAAVAADFRSQYADESFLWNVSAVYLSRLPLGHSFGTLPAPGGARSSASHSAPLRGLGSSQNKFENNGKRRRVKLLLGPPRKQTFGLGSRAHSLGSAQCDPINNGKIQQTETQPCTRTK